MLKSSFTLPKLSILAAAVAMAGFTMKDDAIKPGVNPGQLNNSVQIAFMPDIHFSDVYADIRDSGFGGLPNSKSGKNAVIRSMYAQLTSTRLFNENYFAMLAALDDAAERGIKYIALPGDFSDDGQPMHMKGMAELMDKYREEHGMVFLAAPGNHDPVRPFDVAGGKKDFLAPSGKDQPIYSFDHPVAKEGMPATATSEAAVFTDAARNGGYEGIMNRMKAYGFYPDKDYLYYETPYTTYDPSNYSFEKAIEQTTFDKRQYEICTEGTGGEFKQDGYSNCAVVPDTSYLVEPVEGLWLLAIDANVYVPMGEGQFDGSGNAGFNKILTHKQHVIDWMTNIADRAEEQGKTLVAFSHFPMGDFYSQAAPSLEDMFGEGAFQLKRLPENDTVDALLKTGIKLHVGGHMHFNGTSVATDDEGNFMFNVQAPSLAAYIPGYKILTLGGGDQVEVETVIVDEVDRFDELFEHYQVEHDFLEKNAPEKLWDRSILEVDDYEEFSNFHLKELTRLRFLPGEWDGQMRNMLFAMSGKDMLILSQLESEISLAALQQATGKLSGAGEMLVDGSDLGALSGEIAEAWADAEAKAKTLASEDGVTLAELDQWNGFDLALDFYRIRNAGELAKRDISDERLTQYAVLSGVIANPGATEIPSNPNVGDVFQARFGLMFDALERLSSGAPSDHFMLDMKNGSISTLK